jgi:hypothetical protein
MSYDIRFITPTYHFRGTNVRKKQSQPRLPGAKAGACTDMKEEIDSDRQD